MFPSECCSYRLTSSSDCNSVFVIRHSKSNPSSSAAPLRRRPTAALLRKTTRPVLSEQIQFVSVPPLQNSILQTTLSVRRGIFYTSFTPGFASLHPGLIIFCPAGAEALFRLHGFLTGFTSQFGVRDSSFEIQSFSLLVRSSAPTTTTRSSAAYIDHLSFFSDKHR